MLLPFREHLDFILRCQNEAWHNIDPQAWAIQRQYNDRDFDAAQDKFSQGANSHSSGWMGLAKLTV